MAAIIFVLLVSAGAAFFYLRSRSSSREAHELVSKGAVLIDVRTPEEYAAGHLPGARNVPVQVLAQRMDEVGPKERPVVVYCRSGARSARAKRMLEEKGFKKVVNLGGMGAW